MNRVAVDELSQIDQAFAGNRLLGTFTPEVRALVEPFADVIELDVRDTVHMRGDNIAASVFPYGQTMVSFIVELGDGRSIEVASVGREGAVGGIVSCGHAPAFSHAVVQIAGPALRIPMSALDDAKKRSTFLNSLFCRYSDYLLAQVMQSVACNSFHTIQQRAAGWLLTAQDRGGDRIELTQEAFAALLGVQRTTINAVIGNLHDEGLIAARRGGVTVVDRTTLKLRACECYSVVERHFAGIIGPGGGGAGADCD